jgi:hypothetical protein
MGGGQHHLGGPDGREFVPKKRSGTRGALVHCARFAYPRPTTGHRRGGGQVASLRRMPPCCYQWPEAARCAAVVGGFARWQPIFYSDGLDRLDAPWRRSAERG